MPHYGINWLAILVAGIVPMVVGMIWYSPGVFGKKWMALIGKTEEEIKKSGPGKAYLISFIGSLIMAYVLDYFVYYTESTTFLLGMKIGFATWLGFVVTSNSSTTLFELRPSSLYFMNMTYNLVCMLIMGGILAAWR